MFIVVKNIIKILRFHNLVLGAIAVFVSGYLLSKPFDLLIINCAIVVMFTMGIGNVVNDLFDIKSDKINHPDRPLANDSLSYQNVLLIIFCLFFLLIYFLFQLNYFAIFFLVLFVLPSTFLYNYFFKHLPLFGNVITSLLLSSIFIFTEIVVNNSYNQMLIPFFLCFIFTLLREMIKDMEDYDGDLYYNSYTAPVFFGKRKMNLYIIIYTILSMIAYLIICWLAKLSTVFIILLIIIIEIPLLYSVFLLIKFPQKKTYKYLSSFLKYLCLGGLLLIMLTKKSFIYV